MERTILYYPRIAITNSRWIKQCVLYWDQISSIVPVGEEEHARVPDISFLLKEGVYYETNPEKLKHHYDQLKKLEKELKATVRSRPFRKLIGPKSSWQLDAPIHKSKISYFLDFLVTEGLAKKNKGYHPWLFVENNTAMLFMSLLAKYLSKVSSSYMIPGTDMKAFERITFASPKIIKSQLSLDVRMFDTLPVPREDVPLSDVLDFRRRRRNELLALREKLDDYYASLSSSKEPEEVQYHTVKFKERYEKGINDIIKAMEGDGVASAIGCLKTIVSLKSPTLWGALIVGTGHASKLAEVPLKWSLAGILIMGLIEVGHYCLKQGTDKKKTEDSSPWSYIYHSQKEGIVY